MKPWLEQLKWDDNLAVCVSRIVAENCLLIKRSEMICFSPRENIYTFTIALRMAKKYEFLRQIDDIVRRLVEAGLFQKWQRDSGMYHVDSKPEDHFDR